MTRAEWLASLQTFDTVHVGHVDWEPSFRRERRVVVLGDGAVCLEEGDHDYRRGPRNGFDIYPADGRALALPGEVL